MSTPTFPKITAHCGVHGSAQHLDLSAPAKTRITNATTRDTYTGAELGLTVARPGAAAAMALPSRVGQRLHYRDGRTADATGAPEPAPQRRYV